MTINADTGFYEYTDDALIDYNDAVAKWEKQLTDSTGTRLEEETRTAYKLWDLENNPKWASARLSPKNKFMRDKYIRDDAVIEAG